MTKKELRKIQGVLAFQQLKDICDYRVVGHISYTRCNRCQKLVCEIESCPLLKG